MRALAAATAVAAGLLAGSGVALADQGTTQRGGLDRFYNQKLDWKACNHKELDAAGAQCADVKVPLNYAQPRGRTITVAISRLAASDKQNRRGIMLSNPGGPGGPGLAMTLGVRESMTPDVSSRYDLIGMDPRGVGRSTPVDCEWPVGNMLRSAGVDRAAFDANTQLEKDLAKRCMVKEGPDVRHITTRNTARDMDVIRGALGEQKISYFGVSYGTYLGSVYTQMFPQRSDRFVLDSAVDSKKFGVPMFQDMGKPNEAALDDWANWAAARDGEYHLGKTAKQVRAGVEGLIKQSARQPIRIGEYRLDQHVLPIVLFGPLADSRRNADLSETIRQLTDAAAGKPVQPGEALERDLRYFYKPTPGEQSSAQAAIMCGDTRSPRDPEWYWRNIQRDRAAEPVFGAFANNLTACAFWPEPVEEPTKVHNSVSSLIVQATDDTRTAYESGVALHKSMTGSKLLTLQDVRVHVVFGNYPNKCTENVINTYFRDGTLPKTDITCHED
ncbi:alpha/beta fold hydrolase [Amycolatopsis thailandensis]|uniref:alpha/beta fold hydrolase n=1 Tax=Amycolatopsis thailandensis TaxID=589330 RepID=UPI0036579DAC